MHDAELDRFKRDIHLVKFAARYGYARDARESSRSSHVLRHAGTDDKIIVRQEPHGHWTYFSVRNDRDNGTIVDFVKNRGGRALGEVRQELRQWLGTSPPEPHGAPGAPRGARPLASDSALAFAQASRVDNSLYLNARGIRPETLRDPRFVDTWRQDARRNVLFVHRNEGGRITGCEIKNRGFTGFSPGGSKTAWRSAVQPGDRVLVVAESAIDAISYHQLRCEDCAHRRYLSTAGAPSPRQLVVLDHAFAQLPTGGHVIAAVDADKGGERLAQQLQLVAARRSHLSFTRHSPEVGKDWNEALQRSQHAYIRSLPLAVRALASVLERSR